MSQIYLLLINLQINLSKELVAAIQLNFPKWTESNRDRHKRTGIEKKQTERDRTRHKLKEIYRNNQKQIETDKNGQKKSRKRKKKNRKQKKGGKPRKTYECSFSCDESSRMLGYAAAGGFGD